MGRYTVGNAITVLHVYGIRAQRGYPGNLMPQLSGAVVAVNMHKWEPLKSTLVAEVCAPMTMGVYACEDLAARVAQIWTNNGGVCSYGDHRFEGKSGLYIMKVYGVWEEPAQSEVTTASEETTT